MRQRNLTRDRASGPQNRKSPSRPSSKKRKRNAQNSQEDTPNDNMKKRKLNKSAAKINTTITTATPTEVGAAVPAITTTTTTRTTATATSAHGSLQDMLAKIMRDNVRKNQSKPPALKPKPPGLKPKPPALKPKPTLQPKPSVKQQPIPEMTDMDVENDGIAATSSIEMTVLQQPPLNLESFLNSMKSAASFEELKELPQRLRQNYINLIDSQSDNYKQVLRIIDESTILAAILINQVHMYEGSKERMSDILKALNSAKAEVKSTANEAEARIAEVKEEAKTEIQEAHEKRVQKNNELHKNFKEKLNEEKEKNSLLKLELKQTLFRLETQTAEKMEVDESESAQP